MTDLDWADLLAGSVCWSPEEKRYFNKGIAAYRKDFIMVQKLVGFDRKWSLLVGLKIFLGQNIKLGQSWMTKIYLNAKYGTSKDEYE